MNWQDHPVIYEINAWTWLNELSRKHGRHITLGTVAGEEWDAIKKLGFDAVWLMGVWERSPAGIVIAREKQGLEPEFRRALRVRPIACTAMRLTSTSAERTAWPLRALLWPGGSSG